MTDLRKNLPFKFAAFILSFISIAVFLASAVGIAFMANDNIYADSKDVVLSKELTSVAYDYARTVSEYYENGIGDGYPECYFNGYNFFFEITDEKGNFISGNNSGEKYRFYIDYSYYYYYYEPEADENYYEDEKDPAPIENIINVRLYVKESFVFSDRLSHMEYLINLAYDIRYIAIVIAVVSFIIGMSLYVFLLCAVGHRKGSDGISLNFFDKIPFDVLTGAYAAIAGLELVFLACMHLGSLMYISAAAMLAFDIFLGMAYVLTFANRLKNATFLKNNLCVIIAVWLWKTLCRLVSFFARCINKLPIVWKALVAVVLFSLVEFVVLLLCWYETDNYLLFWLCTRVFICAVALYITYCMKKIKAGGEEIAGGNLSYRLDTSKMIWDFKEHGEALNNIGGGLSCAVDEKMKSERMKTELITNVSHDIKTPLTSIINYVDLLKKEEIGTDKAAEYLEVLDRQSARLKKLVEDLVEASKASTGNITVNMEDCEIGVLLEQTVGEYTEKAEKAKLDLILTKPEEPVIVRADGRHMWRIFDNLMNNICKYAQAHTRVYLSLETKEGKAYITFRNISGYPLNISSDELMERFVRGDSSRNTEGSGLGLSIARSLAELQGGKMELFVDGDLFKAVLSFDTV